MLPTFAEEPNPAAPWWAVAAFAVVGCGILAVDAVLSAGRSFREGVTRAGQHR